MALNDTLLNIGCAAMQAAATHAQLYSSTTNTAGTTNTTAHARMPITWVTAANGDMIMTVDLPFTGGAAGGPVQRVGLFSALTAGTFYGDLPVTGDATSNAAGEYLLTDIIITGTAS